MSSTKQSEQRCLRNVAKQKAAYRCQAVGPSNTAELPDRRPLLAWRYQLHRHQDMDLASTPDCRSGTARKECMGRAGRGECALTARDNGLSVVTSSHFRVGRLINCGVFFLFLGLARYGDRCDKRSRFIQCAKIYGLCRILRANECHLRRARNLTKLVE